MNAPEHVAPPPNATAVALLPIAEIMASRSNPRKHFDDTYIAELADSIKAHGLIQPITVRQARVRGADKATKTRSIRTILLPDEAHAAIKRQQAKSRTVDHVFIHPVSRAPFADTQPPSDAWKRICKLAGIRSRDARQTRHTYATLMLLAGVKPAFVSRQMGHANSQMFFKTYSRWLDSDDDWREVRKLNVTPDVTTTRKPA